MRSHKCGCQSAMKSLCRGGIGFRFSRTDVMHLFDFEKGQDHPIGRTIDPHRRRRHQVWYITNCCMITNIEIMAKHSDTIEGI